MRSRWMSATVNRPGSLGVPGRDQRADVGGAAGDHAVEWRGDPLERLQRLQSLQLGLGGLDQGGLGVEVAGLLVRLLTRDCVLGQQAGPARGGGLGELAVGHRGGQIGPGLGQLLVEFGRVDVGQHLARLHLGADVLVPGLEIAADPGVDLGVVEGLDVAGQHQRLIRAGRRRAR